LARSDATRPTGQIVVLNGPSSAGKTTLARAVRARLGPTSAAVSLDQFYPFVHPAAPNGWQLFSTLTEATFATAVSLAEGGLTVIVDTVFERPESLWTARHAIGRRRHHLVAVTCPLEALEARERARGDRRPGQARQQHERVLQGATYDLIVDTDLQSLEECVDRIVALLEKR
jgi:chloramphenicol 3-O phosphotransferase